MTLPNAARFAMLTPNNAAPFDKKRFQEDDSTTVTLVEKKAPPVDFSLAPTKALVEDEEEFDDENL